MKMLETIKIKPVHVLFQLYQFIQSLNLLFTIRISKAIQVMPRDCVKHKYLKLSIVTSKYA